MQQSAIQALEWLDQNMHTSYPFAFSRSAPITAKSGVVLPNSFIVDMQIIVDSDTIGAPYAPNKESVLSGFFVSCIAAKQDGFVIDVSYVHGGSVYRVATSALIPSSLTAQPTDDDDNLLINKTFQLSAVGQTGDQGLDSVTGTVVIGTCDDMRGLGTMTFDRASTTILPARVALVPYGLKSVTVNGETITRDFILKAGDGVELIVDQNDATPVVTVVNRAEQGQSDWSVERLIDEVLSALGEPVRSINGVGPDDDGNVEIKGGDCTDVNTYGGLITINNTCAKPCCGDVNREQLETALASLETAQTRLLAYYQALTNNVNSIQARLASLIATQ